MEHILSVVANENAVAESFANEHRLPMAVELLSVKTPYCLCFDERGVSLVQQHGRKSIETRVDFVAGVKAHRRRFGGGKSQAIAKAVGLNRARHLSILDATAGMGDDAFVLATLGCTVIMIERSPVVRLLLEDSLVRARIFAEQEDQELLAILNRMTLLKGDSQYLLQSNTLPEVQVVYLDPMFPQRKKSAEVKKEMQFFHDIVGTDTDADMLLAAALEKATHRVVVKRPKMSPCLAGREPGYQLVGKSGRFDVYPIKAITESQ